MVMLMPHDDIQMVSSQWQTHSQYTLISLT